MGYEAKAYIVWLTALCGWDGALVVYIVMENFMKFSWRNRYGRRGEGRMVGGDELWDGAGLERKMSLGREMGLEREMG